MPGISGRGRPRTGKHFWREKLPQKRFLSFPAILATLARLKEPIQAQERISGPSEWVLRVPNLSDLVEVRPDLGVEGLVPLPDDDVAHVNGLLKAVAFPRCLMQLARAKKADQVAHPCKLASRVK